MTAMIHAVSPNNDTPRIDVVSSLDDMAYNKAADAARLKEIFDVRVKQGRGETPEKFGARAGLGKGANVRHYLNGRNSLDEEVARKFAMYIPCAIEDFSPHWARIAQASGQVSHGEKNNPLERMPTHPSVGDRLAQYNVQPAHQSATTMRIPLLSWGRIDQMLESNESLLGSSDVEFVEAEGESVGPRTKFIEMPDDSMAPKIMRGDRLTIEPDWVPEPGEVVLIKDGHGAHHIRIYRQIRPGHFSAVPHNETDYAPLDSIADELTPVGVITARREFLAKRRR
jgi:SOS-response transcriptional repressor LexA